MLRARRCAPRARRASRARARGRCACTSYSSRVTRSSRAKALDEHPAEVLLEVLRGIAGGERGQARAQLGQHLVVHHDLRTAVVHARSSSAHSAVGRGACVRDRKKPLQRNKGLANGTLAAIPVPMSRFPNSAKDTNMQKVRQSPRPRRMRRAAASCPRAARADDPARAFLHRQGRALQRVRIPRHLADLREARAAAEPRLRAHERLLRRHVPHQHQVARRTRPRPAASPPTRTSSGISTAATSSEVAEGLDARRGLPALRVSELERRSIPSPTPTRSTSASRGGPATLKYSYSINDTFGVPNSKGSDYIELAVELPAADAGEAHDQRASSATRSTRTTARSRTPSGSSAPRTTSAAASPPAATTRAPTPRARSTPSRARTGPRTRLVGFVAYSF